MRFAISTLRIHVLCSPVLHFCCILVPHLQNRDNSSAPLHRVIVEISMLRCYGNKGCVILKIEKDVKAESWLVSSLAFCWKRLKQLSRAELHWSFPTETTQVWHAGVGWRITWVYFRGEESGSFSPICWANLCKFFIPSHPLNSTRCCLWPQF